MLVVLIVLLVLFTGLSAFWYRCGGMSSAELHARFPWAPSFWSNRWWRCLSCSLLTTGWLAIRLPTLPWWVYVLSLGIAYGMTTTYHDYITGDDNFFLHGLGIGIAPLPMVIWLSTQGVHTFWMPFVIRAIALALFMGVWCAIFKDDDTEEFGRGGFIQASLIPFLLV